MRQIALDHDAVERCDHVGAADVGIDQGELRTRLVCARHRDDQGRAVGARDRHGMRALLLSELAGPLAALQGQVLIRHLDQHLALFDAIARPHVGDLQEAIGRRDQGALLRALDARVTADAIRHRQRAEQRYAGHRGDDAGLRAPVRQVAQPRPAVLDRAPGALAQRRLAQPHQVQHGADQADGGFDLADLRGERIAARRPLAGHGTDDLPGVDQRHARHRAALALQQPGMRDADRRARAGVGRQMDAGGLLHGFVHRRGDGIEAAAGERLGRAMRDRRELDVMAAQEAQRDTCTAECGRQFGRERHRRRCQRGVRQHHRLQHQRTVRGIDTECGYSEWDGGGGAHGGFGGLCAMGRDDHDGRFASPLRGGSVGCFGRGRDRAGPRGPRGWHFGMLEGGLRAACREKGTFS